MSQATISVVVAGRPKPNRIGGPMVSATLGGQRNVVSGKAPPETESSALPEIATPMKTMNAMRMIKLIAACLQGTLG